jgi:hypothetical protein
MRRCFSAVFPKLTYILQYLMLVSLTTSKREDQIQFVGLRVSIVIREFDESVDSVGKRSKRTWRNSSEYKQILTKPTATKYTIANSRR